MDGNFADWAWWFGHRLLKGNPNVAFAFARDGGNVYRPSLMYNISTDTEVKWKWSDKIDFNLG